MVGWLDLPHRTVVSTPYPTLDHHPPTPAQRTTPRAALHPHFPTCTPNTHCARTFTLRPATLLPLHTGRFASRTARARLVAGRRRISHWYRRLVALHTLPTAATERARCSLYTGSAATAHRTTAAPATFGWTHRASRLVIPLLLTPHLPAGSPLTPHLPLYWLLDRLQDGWLPLLRRASPLPRAGSFGRFTAARV